MTPLGIAEQLNTKSFCSCESFLDITLLENIQGDFAHAQASGFFKRASTGQGDDKHIQEHIRRDDVYWLDPNELNKVQTELWAKINLLKDVLNQNLYLGIYDFEGHYAYYAPGAFYKRHLDAFRKDSSRVVSFICYLNTHWQEGDGGELRLYTGDSFHDVAPRGGTMACFLSQELEHEVLLNQAPRLSFTGWFKTRAVG